MSKLPYNITPQSASVLINGRFKIIPQSSHHFAALCAELRKPEHNVDEIMRLADIMNFVALKKFAGVEIGKDRVMWRGTQVRNVIAERLLTAVMEGYDPEPLSLFLDKLMQNPIKSAQEELYLWLEAGNAPISPDGDFLAFKRVRSNYRDKHTGQVDNSVGKIVEMPRIECDTNRNNHCSRGLHFCQHGYLSSFGGGNDRTVIVKINPADVVSIPTDYQFQKGRTWRYEVVGEVDNDERNTKTHFDRAIDDRYPSVAVESTARDEKISQAIFSKMTKLLIEHLGMSESEVTLGASIIDDLGADSLDGVELIMALEEMFSLKISEEKAESLMGLPLFEVRDGIYDLLAENNILSTVLEDKPGVVEVAITVAEGAIDNRITTDKLIAADRPMSDHLNDAIAKGESVSAKSKRPIPKTKEKAKCPSLKVEKIAEKPAAKKVKLAFVTNAGRTFSAKEILDMAALMSQREAASKIGIGKSTFANWVKKSEQEQGV